MSTQGDRAIDLFALNHPQSGLVAGQPDTFTNTGLGGIPPQPGDPLSSTQGWQDARNPSPQPFPEHTPFPERSRREPEQGHNNSQPDVAQDWYQQADGTIVLTAESISTVSPQSSLPLPSRSTDCEGS